MGERNYKSFHSILWVHLYQHSGQLKALRKMNRAYSREGCICFAFHHSVLVIENYTRISTGLLNFMGNFSKLPKAKEHMLERVFLCPLIMHACHNFFSHMLKLFGGLFSLFEHGGSFH